MTKIRALAATCCLGLASAACRTDDGGAEERPAVRKTPSAEQKSRPVDRLAPGELAESNVEVFGFAVPRGMKLERRFVKSAHMVGRLKPENVANYVRERVEADRVEIGAARTVFPRVYIKGDLSRRVFRIDVVADGPTTKLVLRDITRPKSEKGLSEAERWRRAGYAPDGTPLPEQMR